MHYRMKAHIVALLGAILCMPLTATSSFAGDNRKTEYIEVPGGISAAKKARLWRTAKQVCYDNEYENITEEFDLSTMVCKQDNQSIYLRFDERGFTIRVQAFFNKVPIIGGLHSAPKKHRKKMIEALLADGAK
jgi:hypothetical protein